jgi:hypothetical protein
MWRFGGSVVLEAYAQFAIKVKEVVRNDVLNRWHTVRFADRVPAAGEGD